MIYRILYISVFLFILQGCAAPLKVTEGMTLSEVNRTSVMSIQGNLVSLGRLPDLPEFEIFETEEQNFLRTWESKHGRKSEIFQIAPENTQFYLFNQGRLQHVMSTPQIQQYIEGKKIANQERIKAANRAAAEKKAKEIEARRKEEEEKKIARALAEEEEKQARIKDYMAAQLLRKKEIEEEKKKAEEARIKLMLAKEEEKKRQIEKNIRPELNTD